MLRLVDLGKRTAQAQNMEAERKATEVRLLRAERRTGELPKDRVSQLTRSLADTKATLVAVDAAARSCTIECLIVDDAPSF